MFERVQNHGRPTRETSAGKPMPRGTRFPARGMSVSPMPEYVIELTARPNDAVDQHFIREPEGLEVERVDLNALRRSRSEPAAWGQAAPPSTEWMRLRAGG